MKNKSDDKVATESKASFTSKYSSESAVIKQRDTRFILLYWVKNYEVLQFNLFSFHLIKFFVSILQQRWWFIYWCTPLLCLWSFRIVNSCKVFALLQCDISFVHVIDALFADNLQVAVSFYLAKQGWELQNTHSGTLISSNTVKIL